MEGYQLYVKCDHVSPADVKMGRTNRICIYSEPNENPVGYIDVCNSCKATLGDNYNESVEM
jgi:hypothetical protein